MSQYKISKINEFSDLLGSKGLYPEWGERPKWKCLYFPWLQLNEPELFYVQTSFYDHYEKFKDLSGG